MPIFQHRVTRHSHIIYSPLCPLHLPELMAHKKLIIRFNLDYNVCSPDQQQQFVKHMQRVCGVLLTSCRTLLWRTDTLHSRWGKTKLAVFRRAKRVWLKQLALTPQPTHLFHPVATLEFHSFLSCHFLVVWEQLSTRPTRPKKRHVVQRKCLPYFLRA